MQGTSLLDRRCRILWTSQQLPELRNEVIGKPVWHWTPQHERPILREAIATALIDGQPAGYRVSGPGEHRWTARVEPVDGAQMVLTWRDSGGDVRLTSRETQVLLALCADEPEKVTAQRLGVSIKTIDSFRASLKRKTGAKGVAGLVRYAVRAGLIDA